MRRSGVSSGLHRASAEARTPIIPHNASVLWTGHPIGLIYEDANEGRKPLGLLVRPGFGPGAEWEHSDLGAPDADEGLPGGDGGVEGPVIGLLHVNCM